MTFQEVVFLIKKSIIGTDSDGYDIYGPETKREVFADQNSIKRSEFYIGRQAGYKLSKAFTMRYCDYENENILEHNKKRYKIERTYMNNKDFVELICSEVPK